MPVDLSNLPDQVDLSNLPDQVDLSALPHQGDATTGDQNGFLAKVNAALSSADQGRDQLFYKSGLTQPQREVLNQPLREAMETPLVSPDTALKVLQALNTTDEQGPVQQGIDEAVSKALSSTATGEGISSAPLYAFPPTAVGLSAENVQELPSQVGEAVTQAQQGNIQGAASAGTRAALNALTTGGVLFGGAKLGEGSGIEIPSRAEIPPPPVQIGKPIQGVPLVGANGETPAFNLAQSQSVAAQPAPVAQAPVAEAPLPYTQEAAAARAAQPQPVTPASEPVGGNVAGFEKVYGPGEVPAGGTITPEDAWDAAHERAQKGQSNPYGFMDRARTGAITPAEMGDLIYEHHRLVERAASMEGTPDYNAAYQAAHDFANNVLKPAENAWHQKGMQMQIARPVNFETQTGMNLAAERMKVEIKANEVAEAKRHVRENAKSAKDVQASEDKLMKAMDKEYSRGAKRPPKTAAELRAQLAETEPCAL